MTIYSSAQLTLESREIGTQKVIAYPISVNNKLMHCSGPDFLLFKIYRDQQTDALCFLLRLRYEDSKLFRVSSFDWKLEDYSEEIKTLLTHDIPWRQSVLCRPYNYWMKKGKGWDENSLPFCYLFDYIGSFDSPFAPDVLLNKYSEMRKDVYPNSKILIGTPRKFVQVVVPFLEDVVIHKNRVYCLSVHKRANSCFCFIFIYSEKGHLIELLWDIFYTADPLPKANLAVETSIIIDFHPMIRIYQNPFSFQ